MQRRNKSVVIAATLLCLVLLAGSCGKSPRHATYWQKHDALGKHLTGNFAHGEGDDASARLYLVEIWTYQKGVWLYGEWVHPDKPKRPFRQLVLEIVTYPDRSPGLRVYSIQDPQRFVGAWHDQRKIVRLTKDALREHENCSLVFEQASAGVFRGEAVGEGCLLTRLDVSADETVWWWGHGAEGGPSDEGKRYRKTVNRGFH